MPSASPDFNRLAPVRTVKGTAAIQARANFSTARGESGVVERDNEYNKQPKRTLYYMEVQRAPSNADGTVFTLHLLKGFYLVLIASTESSEGRLGKTVHTMRTVESSVKERPA